MSAKKDLYVSFILDNLRKGIIDYKDNVSVFCEKFRCSDRTFDKFWKLANEAYKIERIAIENKKVEESIGIELEAVKTQIYDKAKMIADLENDIIDIKELLKKGYILKKFTIDGKNEIKKEIFGVKEIESLNRIKDSKYEILKKMQGWDAAKKIEQKNTHEMIGLGVEFVDNDITK